MTPDKRFTHLGFNNWIDASKIATLQTPNSAPALRTIHAARDAGTLIDVTNGRKTKTVIVLTSGQVVVSALAPDTIIGRVEGAVEQKGEGDE